MTINDYAVSVSDRYDAARKALDDFISATPENGKNDIDRYVLALSMADALRTLIEPSATEESVEGAVNYIIELHHNRHSDPGTSFKDDVWRDDDLQIVATEAYQAGIQAAWNTWESDRGTTHGDDSRYWILDTLPDEDAKPFGKETVGIVDEKLGGTFIYCHESEARRILEMLSSEVTDEMIRVFYYDHNCEWLTKYCDEHHRHSALVPLAALGGGE